MANIFAAEPWYQARPEAESMWHGRLEARRTVAGPANRTALTYTLATETDQIAVYAGHQDQVFAPYIGHEVVVRGKLVDLRNEGFGIELWVGSIQQVKPPPA